MSLQILVTVVWSHLDLVTFTEEIVNGKLHFLYSDYSEQANTCSRSAIIEHLKKGRNMFKVNNKNTSDTSDVVLVSLLLTCERISHHF